MFYLYFLLLCLFILILLTYIKIKTSGNLAKINKEFLEKKLVIIITYHCDYKIKEIIKQLVNNHAGVILVSPNIRMNEDIAKELNIDINKMYDSKSEFKGVLTQIKLNTLDLQEINSLTEMLKKSFIKIDHIIYNSMEFIDNNYHTKINKLKGKNNLKLKDIDIYSHNNISYLLLILKLMPFLDRGDGRIINIIGDTYNHSDILNKLYKKNNLNYRLSNEEISLLQQNNEIYDSLLVNFICDNLNNSYSNTCLISLLLLDFIKKYSYKYHENIIVMCANVGVEKFIFIKYLKYNILKTVFIAWVLPISFFFIRSGYWAAQTIIKLVGEFEFFELFNGGLYSKDCKVISITKYLNETYSSERAVIIKIIFNEIKDFFNAEEINKINQAIEEFNIINNPCNKKDN